MDISDAVVGKFILVLVGSLFVLTSLWVVSYPFIDEDSYLYSVIPNPQWYLLFCALWGFCFIGGLMSFTLYHLYPQVAVADTKLGLFHGKQDMPKRDEWIIIGISGVTCGGKTTLANQLSSRITPTYVFHQDKYFFPDDSPRHIRCENIEHNNYDILSALDMEGLYKDMKSTMLGNNKAHDTCTEVGDRFKIEGKKFIIVEGFSALNYQPICDACDLRYYIVLEYGECMSRRVHRLYDPPDVAGYFEQCVWPEHLRYRAQIEKDTRVKILDGTRQDSLDIILADIRALAT